MVYERQVHFRKLADLGLTDVLTWARFRGVEILYVVATLNDGRSRCWSREHAETAEIFTCRVVRDIAERCLTGPCPTLLVG